MMIKCTMVSIGIEIRRSNGISGETEETYNVSVRVKKITGTKMMIFKAPIAKEGINKLIGLKIIEIALIVNKAKGITSHKYNGRVNNHVLDVMKKPARSKPPRRLYIKLMNKNIPKV